MIVAVEYAVALLIGARAGFEYQIPLRTYLVVGSVVVVLAFAGLMLVRLFRAWRHGDAPLDLGPFAVFAAGVMLIALQMAVLTWLKVMLPVASAFWADPLLADLDRAIFGTDPWKITHALFGRAEIIDWVYVSWGPVKTLVLLTVLLLPESKLKRQALISYFLIFGVGCLSQYLLPSGGPIFYERLGLGSAFSSLPIQPWAQATADYLWRDYLSPGGRIGTGISAMPSLHVALALWVALVVRSLVPRLAALGWIYFAFILVGSVHLGWHYAVDGIAAALAVLLLWKAAPLLAPGGRGASSRPTLDAAAEAGPGERQPA